MNINSINNNLKELKLIFHILKLGNNITDTNQVFKIGDTLVDIARSMDKESIKNLFTDCAPELVEMYESKKYINLIKQTYKLQELIKLPTNTLGYNYGKHMKNRGFDPEFYDKKEIIDLPSMVLILLGKTHDIWHVLTGFDTDSFGEIGLQAFYHAQFPAPASNAIVTSGLIGAMKNFGQGKFDSNTSRKIFEYIVEGYIRGKSAKNLFAIEWGDKYWDKDIEELRKELNILVFQRDKVLYTTSGS